MFRIKMNSKEKIKLLKTKIEELKDFEKVQDVINLNEFDEFTDEVKNLLTEKQKSRFNQIKFYEKKEDLPEENIPF